VDYVPVEQRATFQGYKRANGSVGTRNYIGILTSVNCSATVAKFIAEEPSTAPAFSTTIQRSTVSCPSCMAPAARMESQGEGFDILKRTQWGYTSNPNLGAAMLVGLGCEVFQIGRMKELLWHRGGTRSRP
jgi:altronate hydrolase